MYRVENINGKLEIIHDNKIKQTTQEQIKNFFINDLWKNWDDMIVEIPLKSQKSKIKDIKNFIDFARKWEFHQKQIENNTNRKWESKYKIKKLDKPFRNHYLYRSDKVNSKYYSNLLHFYWRIAKSAISDSIKKDSDKHKVINIIDIMTKKMKEQYNISKKDVRRFMYQDANKSKRHIGKSSE